MKFELLYVLNTSCLQLMTWNIIIEVYRGLGQTSEMVDPALSGERHATVLRRGCKHRTSFCSNNLVNAKLRLVHAWVIVKNKRVLPCHYSALLYTSEKGWFDLFWNCYIIFSNVRFCKQCLCGLRKGHHVLNEGNLFRERGWGLTCPLFLIFWSLEFEITHDICNVFRFSFWKTKCLMQGCRDILYSGRVVGA